MRLKTVVADESGTRYTVPTTQKVVPIQTAPEHQEGATLKKAKQPLAHPKRLVAISTGFLAILGVMHTLTANTAPTYPYRKAKPERSQYFDGPGVKEHLTAAENLLTVEAVRSLGDTTLAQKQAILAKNALPLSLIHEATKHQGGEFHVSYQVPPLLLAQYDVQLVAGNQQKALEALTDLVRLHTLQVKGAHNLLFINGRNFDGVFERLEKTRFSAAETAGLRAALTEATQTTPDWKSLSAYAKNEVLTKYLPEVLSGKVDTPGYRNSQNKVNWDTVVNGGLLQQAVAQAQLQATILRYGQQGLVDAYVRYLDALEQRILLPLAEAEKIVLPPVPTFPGSEGLAWRMENLTDQQRIWGKVKERLEALNARLEGK